MRRDLATSTPLLLVCHCGSQVHIRVNIPKSINSEERVLVEKLREIQQSKSKGGWPFGGGDS